MGGAQSTKTLYDCLQLLIEDVSIELDDEAIEKLKKHYHAGLPKISQNIKGIFDFLKKSVLFPLKILNKENIQECNVNSNFQYSLLTSNLKNTEKREYSANFITNFRLMNFQNLNSSKYKGEYECELMIVYLGLKNYCFMANSLLRELKSEQALYWQVYVILWQHYSNHLPFLNTIYQFSSLNKAFDEKYAKFQKLRLEFKAEILGAKLWGTIVRQGDINYVCQQLFSSREKQEYPIPFARIFNALLDLNIDQYNLQFVGDSKFRFSEELNNIIQSINEDSEQLFNKIYTEQPNIKKYLEFLSQDHDYLQNILPKWIVENYLSDIIYNYSEKRIKAEILLLQQEEQKQLIKEYLQVSPEPKILLLSQEEQKQLIKEYLQVSPESNMQIENTMNGCCSLNEIISFECYLTNQQQSTLKILVNELYDKYQKSSIFNSAKTNITENNSLNKQGQSISSSQQNVMSFGEQVQSDLLGSSISNQQPNSQVMNQKPVSLQELKDICHQYDMFKFPIVSKCLARDNNIKFSNVNLLKLPGDLQAIFDFTHLITESDMQKMATFLFSEKDNQQYQASYYNCMASQLLAQLR